MSTYVHIELYKNHLKDKSSFLVHNYTGQSFEPTIHIGLVSEKEIRLVTRKLLMNIAWQSQAH